MPNTSDIPFGGHGGRFEDLVSLAAQTDRAAVLEAVEAMRSRGPDEDLHPRHMLALWEAVARFRGPYIQALEHETNAYLRGGGTPEELNGYLAGRREEMGRLFRRDLEAVIEEVEGQ